LTVTNLAHLPLLFPFCSSSPHVSRSSFLHKFALLHIFPPPHPLHNSSMQCRSTPSIPPSSSCYPIPNSQIAIPPCIPCIIRTNFSSKENKIRRPHQ
jgi:hypothetical protein